MAGPVLLHLAHVGGEAGPVLVEIAGPQLMDCVARTVLVVRVVAAFGQPAAVEQQAIKELRAQGREVPDELLSFITTGHRENINFFGFITVDIEAELAKLIEGWRPLRPTRVHDVGLPFLLNP
ncbi:hypothetical protein ACIBI9_64175 [Nonomuraea sp. NPDC050451]|uniref:hypothetical protein n=1 Tax=Nonomuraea sp. NPDC050451 TaxID=3364364 RepID=UPI0037971516